jgi:hypothetical protein
LKKTILLTIATACAAMLGGCVAPRTAQVTPAQTRSPAIVSSQPAPTTSPTAAPTVASKPLSPASTHGPGVFAKPAPAAEHVAGRATPASTKKCPKGFVIAGTITNISTSPGGMVTESIRLTNGSPRKLPAFKPTKLFNDKVGDPYCEDTTPDND